MFLVANGLVWQLMVTNTIMNLPWHPRKIVHFSSVLSPSRPKISMLKTSKSVEKNKSTAALYFQQREMESSVRPSSARIPAMDIYINNLNICHRNHRYLYDRQELYVISMKYKVWGNQDLAHISSCLIEKPQLLNTFPL
jgi:hypothetical protein